MSTIKEAPEQKISTYLQILYGLFNFLLLGLMVVSVVNMGNYVKSAGSPTSNVTSPPAYLHPARLETSLKELEEDRAPTELSQCSIGSCFDYSRCDGMEELLVYHYDSPNSQAWYFKQALERSPYYTADPSKACLFFVTIDTKADHVLDFKTLPYWNHGLNHVIISVSDNWAKWEMHISGVAEMASTMTSITHRTTYREGFDISVPLPQRKFYLEFQSLKALERKYFLTFKGTRFLGGMGLRNNPVLRSMHNGEDVIVATTCNKGMNSEAMLRHPELRPDCARDQSIYDKYKFEDLMDSTFGLVPSGRGSSSFRLLEVLSAGSIPVVISDNFVLPFDTLIEWRRCLHVFPSSQMHRIVRTLRSLGEEEIEFRRSYCLFIYREFLADDDKIVRTVSMSLKARFFGALPKLNPNLPLPPRHLTMEHAISDSL